ncbi:mitochondrial inner membrane protease subunit 1-like [Liolophura sinensis]|uniref:mitochondrial inner membrane protease subunit 1-like n=1 Tax=Liolophura sinensis TaxID=3198878 RepID=UPI003158C6B2
MYIPRFILRCSGVLGYLVQYGCIAHCALEYGADFVVCSGPSMEPTIHTNDIVLTEHVSVLRNHVQKGDIVIAHSPTNPRQYICKRVVAMEGDRVFMPKNDTHSLVPKGHVWLEGDNTSNSTDSRTYGAIPYGLLRSRVFYRVWPVYDMGNLKHPAER